MENMNNLEIKTSEKKEDKLSKFIDYLFDMKKSKYYLIGILALGFILRIIAALNLGVSADDMHFVTDAINFLSVGKLETYDQSAGLWFAFTDLMYKVFGFTQLGSRIAALIFGSLSVLAIYLLSREFFNEKVALTSAFLLAIAPFHIKLTIAEQDVMAMFFVLLGMFLFVKALKTNKILQFALSGLYFGLAIYTKVYALLFIPSLLLYFVYLKKKLKMKVISKENIKRLLVLIFCIFLFAIPALTHNYLLYKDKGFLDLQFTRTLGLGKNISAQYYSWDHQFNAKNDWNGLLFGNSSNYGGERTPTLLVAFDYIMLADPIIFYLGIIGLLIIFVYMKSSRFDRNYLWFFIFSTAFALPFLASIILLPKHYVFLEILLIPMAAISIIEANRRVFKSSKKGIKIILTIILIISLIFLGLHGKNTNTHFYGKSAVAQAIDFKENIPNDSLIIGDSRIYRGQIHWMLYGKTYLEGSEFIGILKQQNELPGEYINIKVYFLECVKDDCGWGGIENQPEFNASMEVLTEFFKSQGVLVKGIKEPDRFKSFYPFQEKNVVSTFNIYSANIQLKNSVLMLANQPKTWFLNPIGYYPVENNFDYYPVDGAVDNLLYNLARLIVWIALIFALLIPVHIFYLIKSLNNNEVKQTADKISLTQ